MISHKYRLAVRIAVFSLAILAFAAPSLRKEFFSADLLLSEEASFDLWFLQPGETDGSWSITDTIGAVTELPLGMVANTTASPLPIDSVEFQILEVPSALRLDSISTFPGFHVDAQVVSGSTADTNDIHLYVSPEEFTDLSSGTPGAPTSGVEALMSATDEVLRARFRVVSDLPSALPDMTIRGILTARDGDFTRYIADGNPNFPGNNPGTIHPIPIEYNNDGVLQIVSTMSYAPGKIRLEFSETPLSGAGEHGSEQPNNYYVYSCGSHVPSSTSSDTDVNSCQLKTQSSISDPGVPSLVARETNDTKFVDITVDDNTLISGAYYIVRVENVTDEAGGLHTIPEEGIFSQMFRFVSRPSIVTVETPDSTTVQLTFSADLCAANQAYGAENPDNYEILACNSGTSIAECLSQNDTILSDLEILSLSFDGVRTVLLNTDIQEEGAWYIFRLKNLRNVDCLEESELPETPSVYGGLFAGYPGSSTEETVSSSSESQSGEFVLTLSDTQVMHLPWRETLSLRPSGGTAPFSWAVFPAEAGEIDASDPEHVIFSPVLADENGVPMHDQRDVIIRVTDSVGEITEIPVHILRRGDLGGQSTRFLDKTDINDINDVSAGWGS